MQLSAADGAARALPCTCQHHASRLPVRCLQAIAAGHAAAVAALVGGGLDPNSRLPDSGLSLLEAAAHHGRGEVITALIRGGLSGGCWRSGLNSCWRPLVSTPVGDVLPQQLCLHQRGCLHARPAGGTLWRHSHPVRAAHVS